MIFYAIPSVPVCLPGRRVEDTLGSAMDVLVGSDDESSEEDTDANNLHRSDFEGCEDELSVPSYRYRHS